MANIKQTHLGKYEQDNSVIMGPATHVEIDGRHFIVNHFTKDMIGGGAQYPDGLRVYEVTGDGTSGFDMTEVGDTNYSAAGSGLGVNTSQYAYGYSDKMKVFEKDGNTYLAQQTTEKYIIWQMSNSGGLSHVKTIDKPSDIDGNSVQVETPEIHVADDGSVTIMQAAFDTSYSINSGSQPTDHSIRVTKLDSNFNHVSSTEVDHAQSNAATSPWATTDIHTVDIGNNEKLIYGIGHSGSIPVWKIAADGTISEKSHLQLGPNNDHRALTSNASTVQMDSIYNPVDEKYYMVATGSYANGREATLYEINPETGALSRLTHGSGAPNQNSVLFHSVDGDGNGNYDNGHFRDLSAINSIELGVNPDTGEMFFTAHSNFTMYGVTEPNYPANQPPGGVFPDAHYTYGGIATYGITKSGSNWDVNIIEGTLAANNVGMTGRATTFTINGETVSVGFDAWGTDGDQPFGGWSLWTHDASFATESVPCFVKGTRIMTPTGAVAIEHLGVGDLVVTAEGPKPIRWIGSSLRPGVGKTCPVRISAGALGNGLPERDLLVSRQHRMVVESSLAQAEFGSPSVLVSAIKLTALPGVEEVRDMGVVQYFHMLFDGHQIVYAESAPSESLYLGAEAKKALGRMARAEIQAIFPELLEVERPASALPIPINKLQKRIAHGLRDGADA